MPARTDRSHHAASAPPTGAAAAMTAGGALRTAALALLLVVAALYATSHMDQAVDAWVSLAGGRDIAAHGVRAVDPFSFNSRPPEVPAASALGRLWSWLNPSGWINQNWLTHLLYFELQKSIGLDGLVLWKVLSYLLAAAALVAAARVRGASGIPAVLAAVAALLVGRDFISMRAQDLSNVLAAVLVLVLSLAQRRSARWAWALPPLFALWANLHGGYFWGLLIVAVAIVGAWRGAARAQSGQAAAAAALPALVRAGAAAIATVVVLSPYRLSNLTHPLLISVSGDAPLWRVVREWRPLLSNPLSSPGPFLAFAGITVLVLTVSFLRSGRQLVGRFDASGAAIVIVSFALALASGRFVPLACFAAAPFLAVWLDQAAAMVAGTSLAARWRARAVTLGVDVALALVAIAAAVAFTARASSVFLAPWPQDTVRTGLFDRMTHSQQRPWRACAFLAANNTSGRMWNFWDEGGFLAWCQPPDATSGKPPVAIFIDGRAQAAYDVVALRSYLDLLNGPGRSGLAGETSGAGIDLGSLRGWTARRLRELGVWIALVPARQQRTAFARAIAGLPGWQIVYVDPEHSMFADTGNPLGRSLVDRVANGTARFPDDASAELTTAFRLFPAPEEGEQRRAVALARQSYQARPSSLAVLCATRAAREPAARADAIAFCRTVADEFAANRERYRAAAGYAPLVDAAETALAYLATEAKRNDQVDLLRWASPQLAACRAEQERVALQVLW